MHIGKYAGKTLREIIMIEPSYIDWYIINNFDFFISKSTIEEIQQINPSFYLSENALLCRKMKIESMLSYIFRAYRLYFKYVKRTEKNFIEFDEMNFFYLQLSKDLDNFYKLTNDRYEYYENKLDEELIIARNIDSEYEYRNMRYKDVIDNKKYNDDLDMDQQSEEFWNQF